MSADYDLWAEAHTAELEAQARVKTQRERYADAGEELVAACEAAFNIFGWIDEVRFSGDEDGTRAHTAIETWRAKAQAAIAKTKL